MGSVVGRFAYQQVLYIGPRSSVGQSTRLLSVGSDVQVVSGTLESIETKGFHPQIFQCFSFCVSRENLKPEESVFWIFVIFFKSYSFSAFVSMATSSRDCSSAAIKFVRSVSVSYSVYLSFTNPLSIFPIKIMNKLIIQRQITYIINF